MAGKTKPGIPVKGINIKLRMINDLMDVTGSAKDSWNPAEISDDMKAIAYIHDLADTWNPAQLNEALKYLGFATIDSWNPAIIEETKNKLVKYFLPTNASGNPIELDLKGALPYEATSLKIDLLPIQDLHGYDSPWAGGAGKNKLPNGNFQSSFNFSSATVTQVSDNHFIINGTVSGAHFIPFILNSQGKIPVSLPSGTYTLSCSTQKIRCYIYRGEDYTDSESNLGHVTSENATVTGVRFLTADTTFDNEDIYLQLEQGATATSYAPYENICPITGRDSVTLTVNGDDTVITLPETVYGGTVNVIEGGTSSIYGYIASYDGEELPGAWISDRDAYASGTTPTSGSEVAYVLATPTELTTSAEEVTLINGVNTLLTDGDTINITYKAILNS